MITNSFCHNNGKPESNIASHHSISRMERRGALNQELKNKYIKGNPI
jgi:hypothetical protein